jgi:hypothetical protein
MSESLARIAILLAVLASSQVGCITILLLVDVDATLALQYEVLISNLGDEVLTRASGAQAVLVVCEGAALAVDERRNIWPVVADFTDFNVAGAENIAARQCFEDFTDCLNLWRGCLGRWVWSVDVVLAHFAHVVRGTRWSLWLASTNTPHLLRPRSTEAGSLSLTTRQDIWAQNVVRVAGVLFFALFLIEDSNGHWLSCRTSGGLYDLLLAPSTLLAACSFTIFVAGRELNWVAEVWSAPWCASVRLCTSRRSARSSLPAARGELVVIIVFDGVFDTVVVLGALAAEFHIVCGGWGVVVVLLVIFERFWATR